MNLSAKIKELVSRANMKRRAFAVRAANFAADNKDALVIIADPDTDVILISQGGVQLPVRFVKPGTGENMKIVANAIHYENKKTNKAIDQFLLAVDSALFNLARVRYDRRKRGIKGKIIQMTGIGKREEFEKGSSGTRSPFQMVDVGEQPDSDTSVKTTP